MCKDKNKQREHKNNIRKMVPYARIRAIYENLGTPDLLGFFLEANGRAALVEIIDGKLKLANTYPVYAGMGNERVAHLLSPIAYATNRF